MAPYYDEFTKYLCDKEVTDMLDYIHSDSADDTYLAPSGSILTAETRNGTFTGSYVELLSEPDNIPIAAVAPPGIGMLHTAPSATTSSSSMTAAVTPVSLALQPASYSSVTAVEANPLAPSSSTCSNTVSQCTQQDIAAFYSCFACVLARVVISFTSLRLPGRQRAASGARVQKLGRQAAYRVIVRALAVLLADPFITATIHAADEIGNLTQPQCDSIMEKIIGCPHPRYAKQGESQHPRALLYPQTHELTTSGAVCYLARFLSHFTGYFVNPLLLSVSLTDKPAIAPWFTYGGNGYEVQYELMKAELGTQGFTRSWTLPLDLNQIRGITLDAHERVIVKPARAKKGESQRAKAAAAKGIKNPARKPKTLAAKGGVQKQERGAKRTTPRSDTVTGCHEVPGAPSVPLNPEILVPR